MVVERYSREEMSSLWEHDKKWRIALEIEVAVCEFFSKIGEISAEDYKQIKDKADFNYEDFSKIEQDVKHDFIAFLTNVASYVGESSRFIHKGLTTSDILDTVLSIQLTRSCDLLISLVDDVLDILKKRAYKHKNLFCVGRTHGIHAEPTVFGLRFVRFFSEFQRHRERLNSARKEVAVCKISGALGNFSNVDPRLEIFIAEKFGLSIENAASQVISRDRYAFFFSILGGIASSIENIAVEVRHLQRTEVLELSEYFSDKQKGSSAMPHKRNPVLSENLTGLARMVRSFVIPAMENVALWHERDISHSSVERFICPDACITLDFALDRLKNVLQNCVVHENNVKRNLNALKGLVFSQKVLLKLVDVGFSREDAYLIVQQGAAKVWDGSSDSFFSVISEDNRVSEKLSKEEIESLFSTESFYKGVDIIYDRVF
ncbi:adenylosuccinate lyase [Anaplasmataceae bacterium AB001_6]|nr:adenylosuccinate lyase [Anaplasmataceae bacterium AB001_6]